MTDINNLLKNMSIELNKSISSSIRSASSVINLSDCLKPTFDSLNDTTKILIEQINESLRQPIELLMSQLVEVNKNLTDTISKNIASIAYDALNNLKTISLYSEDDLESINKSKFIDSMDEIYNVVDNVEFNDCLYDAIIECKKDIIEVKNELSNSNSKEFDIHQWVTTITTIISIILSILSSHGDSSKTMIEHQEQIIELQSTQIDTLETINNSLEKLIESKD